MIAPCLAGRLTVSRSIKEIPMTASAPTSTRELHSRPSDGIHVRLLWRECDGKLWVAVIDNKAGGEFCMEVQDPTRALDVFHHPYAYAAHSGLDTRPAAAEAASTTALPV
jgi:hypothetical protein